jgi:DNA (cytosine-5)-methyltransferase 1
MKHLDLFSGIGGAALAVEAVWPDAEHIFVEIDQYCQALLKKRFPNSQIHGDIRTLTANPNSGGQEEQEQQATGNKQRDRRIDILTGGFPCQPFSQAGRRKGTSDNRFLWPEMLRVIREFKPTWIVGENVAGLLSIEQGVVFKQIIADLEAEGYEIENFVIPAVAVNAPHRRDRVWIVANSKIGNARQSEISGPGREGKIASQNGFGLRDEPSGSNKDASNARQSYGTRSSEKLEANKTERSARKFSFERGSSWNENWVEVATRLCRVDDGIPRRVDRLRTLGNAQVPRVAAAAWSYLSHGGAA